MKTSRRIVTLLGVSALAALAGCMAETSEGDANNQPDLANAESASALTSEEDVGEAASAQYYHSYRCPWGSTYVPAVNFCVYQPARFDYTSGAFGCIYGGIRTGRGNIICLPTPSGIGSWPPPPAAAAPEGPR